MKVIDEIRQAILREKSVHQSKETDNLFQAPYNMGYQDAIQRMLNDLDIIEKNHEEETR